MYLGNGLETESLSSLVTSAIKTLIGYETGTTVAEIADCAYDQSEYTVYMTPSQDAQFQADLQGEVLHRFGLDSGASDATDISQARLLAVMKKGGK